jgi:hypothetical protein
MHEPDCRAGFLVGKRFVRDRPKSRTVSHRLSGWTVAGIEQLRRERKWSARRIAAALAAEGITTSVRIVGRHLAHLGPNKRRFLDPHGAVNRKPGSIVARWPGCMIHLDVKDRRDPLRRWLPNRR